MPAPPRTTRVLVVDDDQAVRDLLRRFLELEGYLVDEAADAEHAWALLSGRPPDLVLLDAMLPFQDGFDFLSRLRQTSDLPVIMLTARDDGASRVLGLRLGADDYVVKPFSIDELEARIETVLRRTGRRASQTRLEFGDLVIDLGSRKVTAGGEPVELTAKEFALLAFLAAAPGRVFTRQQLLEHVWGSSSAWQDPRTVTEHVRRVRQKIERARGGPVRLETVRGVGYRFDG